MSSYSANSGVVTVACVFKDSVSTNRYGFYIDDAAAAITTTASASIPSDVDAFFAIGFGANGAGFSGSLLEFVHFNRTLTAAQMKTVTTVLFSKWRRVLGTNPPPPSPPPSPPPLPSAVARTSCPSAALVSLRPMNANGQTWNNEGRLRVNVTVGSRYTQGRDALFLEDAGGIDVTGLSGAVTINVTVLPTQGGALWMTGAGTSAVWTPPQSLTVSSSNSSITCTVAQTAPVLNVFFTGSTIESSTAPSRCSVSGAFFPIGNNVSFFRQVGGVGHIMIDSSAGAPCF